MKQFYLLFCEIMKCGLLFRVKNVNYKCSEKNPNKNV